MNYRKIQIVIDNEGNYTLEAMEGFSGASCVQGTQEIEVAIGGSTTESEKKDEYYMPDNDTSINLFIE